MADAFRVFSGTGNPVLAAAVATEIGVRPGLCFIGQFPDGETGVRLDESVRGSEVFLVQPTSPPVNDRLMELLAFADACCRSAAARITVVVPYFGYARSDKRHSRRQPITASLVAQLMQAAGIDHVVTLDLHAAQIEGFFRSPVDSLTAVPVLCQAIKERVPAGAVVVFAGRREGFDGNRVWPPARLPGRHLAQERTSGTETEVTHVVGDVRGRTCLIIDDMISTGGTIDRAVEALLAAGARPEISIAATHGLFVGDARTKLNHEAISDVFVTDSVAIDRPWPTLRIVSNCALARRGNSSGPCRCIAQRSAPPCAQRVRADSTKRSIRERVMRERDTRWRPLRTRRRGRTSMRTGSRKARAKSRSISAASIQLSVNHVTGPSAMSPFHARADSSAFPQRRDAAAGGWRTRCFSSDFQPARNPIMQPFRTILFAADFSENSKEAFRAACSLAVEDKTKLVVLHVVEPKLATREPV